MEREMSPIEIPPCSYPDCKETVPHKHSTSLSAFRQEYKKYNPLTDESFNPNRPVWYLAHPVAPDEHFTFQQNMDDIVACLRLCTEAGIQAIAPYHTLLLFQQDDNDAERKFGLECDCAVVKKLGRIILAGHKISNGMACELQYANYIWSLVGKNVEDMKMELAAIARAFK